MMRVSRAWIEAPRFGFNRRRKAVSARQRRAACRFFSLCGSHDTHRVIIWPLPGRTPAADRARAGSWNEKDNRERGSRSCADVVGREGRGTGRRRRAGGRIGRRRARADRSSGWRRSGLYSRTVDFAFMGPAPLERAAPGAESREPGRACPCRRQSTRTQSVRTQRSSSSSSGRASRAVHHHHGFHRAAGPATGVSGYRCRWGRQGTGLRAFSSEVDTGSRESDLLGRKMTTACA